MNYWAYNLTVSWAPSSPISSTIKFSRQFSAITPSFSTRPQKLIASTKKMGNCVEKPCAFIPSPPKETIERDGGEVMKKVRLVLTKSEVEWLTKKLGEKQVGRKLNDLLTEMAERSAGEEKRWRPALDSIEEVSDQQSSFDDSLMELPIVQSFGCSSAPLKDAMD